MMRDPHVVDLYYRLETDPPLIFDHPPPLDHDTDKFTLHLADGALTCTMKRHYASVEEAQAVVTPFLRTWGLDDALERGRCEIRFVFEKAKVIDRDPPPGGQTSSIHTMATRGAGGRFVLRAVRDAYPTPPNPEHFTASPDVETLWGRYEGYKKGQEPLLAMAYFCLSFLKWRGSQHPGRGGVYDRVEAQYAIKCEVLDKLGCLTTNLGDATTARKVDKQSRHRPPTPHEAVWIDAAVKMLIRRVGEYDADPAAPWPTLSMHDLPPL
jgi:hypothetical protein